MVFFNDRGIIGDNFMMDIEEENWREIQGGLFLKMNLQKVKIYNFDNRRNRFRCYIESLSLKDKTDRVESQYI